MNKIGEYISLLRRKKGFTQVVLGEIIGVSSKTISKWENGDGLPDVTTLPALAQALGTSVDALLEGGPIPISRLIKSLGAKKDLEKLKFFIISLASLVVALISIKWLFPYITSTELYFKGHWIEGGNIFNTFTYLSIILVTMFLSKQIYYLGRSKRYLNNQGKKKVDIIFEIIWLIPIVYILTFTVARVVYNTGDMYNLAGLYGILPLLFLIIISVKKFKKYKNKA